MVRERKVGVKGPSEHQIQAAFIRWVRLNSGHYPELRISYAVPNGGLRNIVTAKKLKAEGVVCGIPDWVLPVPKGKFTSLCIEFKSAKGTLSDAQKEKIGLLLHYGWRVHVCRSWEDAAEKVIAYLERGE